MRGLVAGLESPYPLGDSLPGLYRDDLFTQQLCAGLDEVLAPIVSTLDNLPAYFDPATSPDDMLGWLSGWLGIVLDSHQSAERQREFVRTGVDLLRWRGTARGVRAALDALFDGPIELTESGGSTFGTESGTALPGSDVPELVVRLGVPEPDGFDVRRLDALVALVKPAHIPHRVELFQHT